MPCDSSRTRRRAAASALAIGVVLTVAAPLRAAHAQLADKAGDGQPQPRYDHVLSTLPDGRILLFGGEGESLPIYDGEDTWVWDGLSFTNYSYIGGNGPAPRSGATMAAGVMSGGVVNGAGSSSETWTFGVFANHWIACPGCGYDPGVDQAACGLRLLNTNGALAHAYVTAYGTGPYFATYEHNTGWYAAQSAPTPPPRVGHAMASIGTTRAAIFGGAGNSTSLIDAPAGTGNWETYTLPGSPDARYGTGLAAESAGGNTYVMFGGSTLDARTWRLTQATPHSASAWQVVATNGPPPRDDTALAFDPVRGTAVLFGGIVNGTVLGDLWEWTPATNSWARRNCVEPVWLDLTTDAAPPARSGHCLAWDRDRKVAVLFGGSNSGANLGDTWEYDGSTWTLMSTSGPAPRRDAAMAYDEARQEVVLFGGTANGANLFGDTWVWKNGSWQLRSTSGGPSARMGAAMAFDLGTSAIMLAGGDDDVQPFLCRDTWQWDGASWILRGSGGVPIPRLANGICYAAIAREATSNRLVLYGGLLHPSISNGESFLWDNASGTWINTPLDPASPVPAGRSRPALAWNAARDRLLMFGGVDDAGRRSDSWELGYDATSGQWTWQELAITGASARSHHAMVYDDVRGGVLLFGGLDGTLTDLADSWCFLGDAMQDIQVTDSTQQGILGAPVTLTLQHTGAVLACTWSYNNVLIPGATGTTYTIPAVGAADAGTYLVKAVGPCSSGANAIITLEVASGPPTITTQPTAQTVCDNAPVSLSVAVTGTPPFEYQWWRDNTPPYNNSAAPIPGATGPSFSLAHAHVVDSGMYWVQVTNAQGLAMSNGVMVTVNPTVRFTRQPAGAVRCQGGTVTLSAGAAGGISGQPLEWGWTRNGVPVPGANDSTLVVGTNELTVDTYIAAVAGACGVAVSDPAHVSVGYPPILIDWVPTTTVCEGDSLQLPARGLTIPPATYAWRKNGVLIPGATDSVLTFSPVTAADDALYQVTVENLCGLAQATADVTVRLRPVITTQPAGQASCGGAPVTFAVAVAGAPPLGYQWQFEGTDIPGATGATFTIASPTPADQGRYRVLVTNACAAVASAEAQLTVGSGVVLSNQTPGARVCEGSDVTFSVTATGATTYQWRRDGVDLGGATGPSLTLPAVTAAAAGIYTVLMTGSCGTLSSAPDTLVVDGAPVFTQQPVAVIECGGGTVSFTAAASGTPAPTYRWFHNGLVMPGQTAPTLVTAATTPAAGVYRVEADTPGCIAALSQRAPLSTACGAASWIRALPSDPPARAVAAMAYDQARGKAVLFGGVDDNGAIYFGDTWERDSATGAWTQVAVTGPSARQGAVMVYDPLRQVTWLYGGHYSDGATPVYFDDLWKWNGSTWTQVTGLPLSPGQRWGHAMTWDADRGKVVLYGGWNSPPVAWADTWTWDGTAWTQVATTGPGPRALMAMTYDLARGRVVLFGGVDETGQGYLGGPGQQSDTWTWDGAAWTLAATTGPAARQGHVLCYDNVYNTVIMFGGAGGGALLTDTWSWDGSTWTRRALSGPTPRMYLPATYDEQSGEVLVFGGYDASGEWAVGGTWAWAETGGPSAVDDTPPAVSFAGPAQLLPCVPNPFNPRTELRFALAGPLAVTLKIYDLQGRCVRTVAAEQAFATGAHAVPWNGVGDDGRRLSSGVYQLRMTAGSYRGSQRLVLIK